MDPAYIWFPIFTLSTSLAGLFLNIFITAVSSRSWWKGGTAGDVILIASGVFNVIRQIFLLVSSIIYCFFPQLALLKIFYTIFFNVYSPLSTCTSWMTSWLCIFYCIKITNFRGTVFLFLKSHFSKMVYGLILVSAFLSYLLISPFMEPLPSSHTAANGTLLETMDYLPYEISNTALAMALWWLSLPVILIVLSLGLTLTSLTMHVYRMKKSACFRFTQIKGHLSAMTTMTFLLTLYMTFSFSQIILTLNSIPTASLWRQTGLIFHFTFTLMQAIVLILGNPKLSSAFRGITKCRKTEDSEPPE